MKKIITSESVNIGHPDKTCDTIADAFLDEALKQDPNSMMAVECAIKNNKLFIYGEATTKAKINYEKIAKEILSEIGYNCKFKIVKEISEQSPDINQAVVKEELGANDQGMCFGYATDETEEYMPYAIAMAHKLAKRLTEVRRSGEIPYIRPDGKTQVTVEYENDQPKRIETILISTQHEENVDMDTLKKDLIEKVIRKVIPEEKMDAQTKIYINPTGRFVIGGPLGDTGLTGRKIIVDTYGGYAKHGGGCFSGKDASKVDRSAAYMLRHIAKNLVANGYAKKCEIQVAYAIGMKEPLSICVNTFGTSEKSEEELVALIQEKFDLTPAGIIQYLDLKRPIYQETTNYGHFGKENLPWEQIKKI